MSRKYTYLVMTVLFLCCDGDEDEKPRKIKYASLQVASGDGQSGATGALLSKEIVMKVSPIHTGYRYERFYIQPEKISGNGTVYDGTYRAQSIQAGQDGTIQAKWSLGCDKAAQSVTFYLYYADSCRYSGYNVLCDMIDSVTVKATASTPHGWNRSCGIIDADNYNTKIRIYNNTLYAVNYGKLYKAEMGMALSWVEVPGVPVTDIFDFNFTGTGQIYLLTNNHGVYTSADLRSWTYQSNGILDQRYPMGLLVEDSVVYASFRFDGLYRLRPSQGNFWRKLLIDGKYYDEYEFITRHPNGKLYAVDKWDSYWISPNSGNTWTRVPIEYKYVNYDTEDLKIHNSGLIYIGSGDASLAILNPDTHTGTLRSYYQWNASSQHINNIIFRNSNDVYYLVNATPSPGIYSSVNGWQRIDLGFTKKINQFVIEGSGNFILGAYDGLYYWKE